MQINNNIKTFWTICEECGGDGKKNRKLKKTARHNLYNDLSLLEEARRIGNQVVRVNRHLYPCEKCSGSGLQTTSQPPLVNANQYPHIAIIGGGIGGVALAVACLHRGIPFTLYERDSSFDARAQGYGLTLQQASKSISGFGLTTLKDGVHSTLHVMHTPDGEVIGEWGMRKHISLTPKKPPKRTNIHISRQSLRSALLSQLGQQNLVNWGHRLTGLKEIKDEGIELSFDVNGRQETTMADLVVGADGIRSSVRKLMIEEQRNPLRFLGCIVILGICPLTSLNGLQSKLLDSATVFQTANGQERIYIMPYDKNSVMWQLSFPMTEMEAKTLSAKGPNALKEEACKRIQWHDPIPQILAATNEALISGYPVYDRSILKQSEMEILGPITLIGDAAHPMSPFKGQGANQALLDSLALARTIAKNCKQNSNWRNDGIRKTVLTSFEFEMLERSAIKVKDSEKAAEFLHSNTVLEGGNRPRGGMYRDAKKQTKASSKSI